MDSENGWILPDGRYVECPYLKHMDSAENEFGLTEDELEKTAVKVSCLPPLARLMCGIKEYRPNFLTERKKMTKAQLRTIEKYCVEFGYRPPLDYFLQQGLYEMAKMDTERYSLDFGQG